MWIGSDSLAQIVNDLEQKPLISNFYESDNNESIIQTCDNCTQKQIWIFGAKKGLGEKWKIIWSNVKDIIELQEIIYEIHLKFDKEFISWLRFKENSSTKSLVPIILINQHDLHIFGFSIGLKGFEAFLLNFHTSVTTWWGLNLIEKNPPE